MTSLFALAWYSTRPYPKNVSRDSPKILFSTFWWYPLKPEVKWFHWNLNRKYSFSYYIEGLKVTGVNQRTLTSLAPSSHWVWVYEYWILNVQRAPEMSRFFNWLPLFSRKDHCVKIKFRKLKFSTTTVLFKEPTTRYVSCVGDLISSTKTWLEYP